MPVKAKDEKQKVAAERVYGDLVECGVDALFDDRDERPGVKFKDADLIGIPFRIVVGPRSLARDAVELFERASGETTEVPVEQAASRIGEKVTWASSR